MTDTDLLHMAVLEAKLTEAEKMLDRADTLLNRAILVNYIDIKSADDLQRKIRTFLGE